MLRHKDANGVNFSTLLLTYQNICGIALYFPADVLGFQVYQTAKYLSMYVCARVSAYPLSNVGGGDPPRCLLRWEQCRERSFSR